MTSPSFIDVTIANGGTISGEANLANGTACGLYIDSAFTGTTITFQACYQVGQTYAAVKDGAGANYSVTVAPGQYIPLDYTKFLGIACLRVVSGSTEAAARLVKIATKQLY